MAAFSAVAAPFSVYTIKVRKGDAFLNRGMKKTSSMLAFAVAVVMSACLWCQGNVPSTFNVYAGQSLTLPSMPFLSVEPQAAVQVGAQGQQTYSAQLKLLGAVPVKQVQVNVVEQKQLIVCGTPFGIKMFSKGVMVVGFTDIITFMGERNPAKQAGLKMGDVIVSIDGGAVSTNEDIAAAVSNNSSGKLKVLYLRDGEERTTVLQPVKEQGTGIYKVGMWVRDSSAGVGTLTFINPQTGVFGGLGHSINDTDTGQIISLLSGEIVDVEIMGVIKGVAGSPGELQGRFSSIVPKGVIRVNGVTGVFGELLDVPAGETVPMALSQQVEVGPAQIITTIDGSGPQTYDCVIEKVSLNADNPNKNMVVRITDKTLIAKTGGIVQGMSGSPIMQNGMLIGALTHVLVGNPEKGYAIFAENMLLTTNLIK